MTQAEARARVARGAAHLDQVRPGWFRRIDTGTLTLHDPCGCIVGQLCGTGDAFRYGLQILEVKQGDEEEFGFELPIAERIAHYPNEFFAIRANLFRPLQDAWIDAIADRLHPVESVEPAQVEDAGATSSDKGATESAHSLSLSSLPERTGS